MSEAWARGYKVGAALPKHVRGLLPEGYEPWDEFSKGWYEGLMEDPPGKST